MMTIDRLSVVTPANWISGSEQGEWTYEAYVAMPEDGHRYEVVDGVLYVSPSPNSSHQLIVGEIYASLRSAILATGLGLVYLAPFDVELNYKNIVQPDVFMALNEHLDRDIGRCFAGAPDLVVEVASPGTVRHDSSAKLNAYAKAGVPEYWLIFPDARTVELLVLKDGVYDSLGLFSEGAILPSKIIPDMTTKVEQFFADISK